MRTVRRFLLLPCALVLTTLPLHAQWSVDSLTAARKSFASASDGRRAYFAGGRNGTARSAVVDVFDSATASWSSTSLSAGRSELAATLVGPYVLVAGGSVSPTRSTAVVDVLDTRTMTWGATAKLSQARFGLAATTVGTKAIFAGGALGGPGGTPLPTATVDVYDSALGPPDDAAAWSQAALTVARAQLTPATVGSLALFAGGIDGSSAVDVVDVYDDATGTWSTARLSQARMMEQHAAATAGQRVYFAGGTIDLVPTLSDVIDVFDATTRTWTTLTLSAPRASLSAASLGDLVFFAGGIVLAPTFASTELVDVLRSSTATWLPTSRLSSKRHNLASSVAGDRVLFAGGDEAPVVVATVDLLRCRRATSTAYAGRGLNDDLVTPVDAVLGGAWSAPLTIVDDHGKGGLLLLEVRTRLANGSVLPVSMGLGGSERLIAGPLLFSLLGSHDGKTGDVSVQTIPMDVGLLGMPWAAQYVVFGGGRTDLSQAVAGVVGCP